MPVSIILKINGNRPPIERTARNRTEITLDDGDSVEQTSTKETIFDALFLTCMVSFWWKREVTPEGEMASARVSFSDTTGCTPENQGALL